VDFSLQPHETSIDSAALLKMEPPSHATAPMPVPLPRITSEDCFTETQWQVLFAALDAIVPSIVAEGNVTDKRNQLRVGQRQYEEAFDYMRSTMAEPPDLEKFKEYLRTRQSDSPRFVQNVKRTFETVPEDARNKLVGVLKLLRFAFYSCHAFFFLSFFLSFFLFAVADV
jgi:hypothetical protein